MTFASTPNISKYQGTFEAISPNSRRPKHLLSPQDSDEAELEGLPPPRRLHHPRPASWPWFKLFKGLAPNCFLPQMIMWINHLHPFTIYPDHPRSFIHMENCIQICFCGKPHVMWINDGKCHWWSRNRRVKSMKHLQWRVRNVEGIWCLSKPCPISELDGIAFNYHIGHCCTAVVLSCFLDVELVHFGHHQRNVPWFLAVLRAPHNKLVPVLLMYPLNN